MVEFRVLSAEDGGALRSVAEGVFDGPVDDARAAEFLDDPRHHICVAIQQGEVVGFASAVHYVHPDKPAELWINEVGVAPAFQGRGLAKEILRELLSHARSLGCRGAWVLTDEDNVAARALYSSMGGRETPRQRMVDFDLT